MNLVRFFPLIFITSLLHSAPVEVTGIAAKVNGSVVTKKEVAMLLGPAVARLRAANPRMGPEFEKKFREIYDKALEELIDRELVLNESKTLGLQIRPQMIDEEISREKRENYNNNDAKFREDLAKSYLTMDGYRELVRKKLTMQAMRQSKFSDAPPPLPSEIQKEYNSVKLKMRDTSGDKLYFHKMYIPAVDPQNPNATPEAQLKLAEDIVKQLKNGSSFEELAKKHSRDAYSTTGGKQENVASTDLAPEFSSLITDPPAGTIVGPLMDRAGLTIARLDKIDYGPVPPLSKIKEQLEQRVTREKTAARYERWIKTLRSHAMITKSKP